MMNNPKRDRGKHGSPEHTTGQCLRSSLHGPHERGRGWAMRSLRPVHSSAVARAVCSLILLGASFAGAGEGTLSDLSGTPSQAIPHFQRPKRPLAQERPVLRTLLQGEFEEEEFLEWARHATHDDMQARIDEGMAAHRAALQAEGGGAGGGAEDRGMVGGNDTAFALLSRAGGFILLVKRIVCSKFHCQKIDQPHNLLVAPREAHPTETRNSSFTTQEHHQKPLYCKATGEVSISLDTTLLLPFDDFWSCP
jgi:hypothetical protein